VSDVPLEEVEPERRVDVPGDAVLSVRNLFVAFPSDDGLVHAVDNVSFDVFEN
jgi:ABC-type glutathione transport system ATPase component